MKIFHLKREKEENNGNIVRLIKLGSRNKIFMHRGDLKDIAKGKE